MGGESWTLGVLVVVQGLESRFADRYDPLLGSFAETPDDAEIGVDVFQMQAYEFRDAQAARVEDLQYGPISPWISPEGWLLHRVQESSHFVFLEYHGEALAYSWGIQESSGVLFDRPFENQETKKRSHGRETSSDRPGLQPLLAFLNDELEDLAVTNLFHAAYAQPGKAGDELLDVVTVGRHRMRRKSTLKLQVAQKPTQIASQIRVGNDLLFTHGRDCLPNRLREQVPSRGESESEGPQGRLSFAGQEL